VDIEKQVKTELNLLNEENFNLIIWKSFDRLNEAFEGKTDIDFYLSNQSIDNLDLKLKELNWVKFKSEHWRNFIEVHDYFKFYFDNKKKEIKLIHFHIHEKIRTGDRFIKSLEIPAKFINSDLEYRNAFLTLNRMKEFELSIMRSAFKLKIIDYIMSLIRFDKQRLFIYQNETKSLYNFLSAEDIKNLELNLNFKLITYLSSESIMFTWACRRKIKNKYKKFKKYKPSILFYFKLISSKILIDGKYIKKGLHVSIVGVDGVGKSSSLENIYSTLGNQIRFKVIYFGIPKSIAGLRKKLFTLKNIFNKNKKTEYKTNSTLSNSKFKVLNDTVFSVLVTLIKILKFIQLKIFLFFGYIVFTDRYPIEDIVDFNPQWKSSKLLKLQFKTNNIFTKPQLFVLLTLNEDDLDSRNKDLNSRLLTQNKKIQLELINYFKKNNHLILDNMSCNFKSNEMKILEEMITKINSK
tara:strand:- start:1807 stop:3201 length:1395 start_codon:yes stop_codon:yes gene_type:complete